MDIVCYLSRVHIVYIPTQNRPAVYLHWKETVPEPPNMVRATGQYFFDDKGVKYLDMCNNVAHGR